MMMYDDPRYESGMMEPGRPFGYHYPAGTPGPRTEHTILECENGHRYEGRIIHDLGAADTVPETCPECKGMTTKRSDDQAPIEEIPDWAIEMNRQDAEENRVHCAECGDPMAGGHCKNCSVDRA